MNIVYATLEQVLAFRDERRILQKELLEVCSCPLVSFSMNIAGPYKRTALIEFAFNETLRRLRQILPDPVCYREIRGESGCEALWAADLPAEELKNRCVMLEESEPIGRLLDLDVLDQSGQQLSRDRNRACIVCGGPVFPCARSRAHSLFEISEKTDAILRSFAAHRLGELAVEALLEEVHFTPKPGLVDENNSGAHKDMDLPLMEKSAHTLLDYFVSAAALGLEHPKGFPRLLQLQGVRAEDCMFAATSGVNTHKGAVFSLGILTAAVGLCLAENREDIFAAAAEIAIGLENPVLPSHGETVRSRYSRSGVREEAAGGFPHVQKALGILCQGGTHLDALLTLIAELDDSNLLYRGGEDGLLFLQNAAKKILFSPENEKRRLTAELDRQCIMKNLSPGGSADLFAAALFIDALRPPVFLATQNVQKGLTCETLTGRSL